MKINDLNPKIRAKIAEIKPLIGASFFTCANTKSQFPN
ncbi:MAG: hypothetical protein BWX65_00260 [Bacteroidetes bacterium ADurb.Bin057]|nr:MAG: hypothetical protein BWX65_00260 [Bacteroidetes bacterium ADurb.Bin057]